jgi:hypothetical protein
VDEPSFLLVAGKAMITPVLTTRQDLKQTQKICPRQKLPQKNFARGGK